MRVDDNRTYMPKKNNVENNWRIFDASGKVLGHFATEIAKSLMGKDKPGYVPHINIGDRVVVINASEIEVTGKKADKKVYYRHTGYPGGIKQLTFRQMMAKDPRKVIELAVKRMLPQNKLKNERMSNLHVYNGSEHKHQAQFGGKGN